MKILKRILPMMLVVMLLAVALPTFTQAKTYEQEKGDTVTVSIPVTEGFGGMGTVTFSNEALFSSIKIEGKNLGSFQENNRKIAFSSSSEITNGAIVVTVKIKTTASAGDTCMISVADYQKVNASDNMETATLESQVVTVKTPTTPNPPNPPQPPVDKTDYTELKKQINIAESLKANEYTVDSWNKLATALTAGRAAVGCGNQTKVDTATKALKDAIAGLVKIDYSKLQQAMDSADTLIESDKMGTLWNKLFEALENGSALLGSRDQAAIDKAAKDITDIIDEIKALLKEETTQPTVTEPTGDYCNVSMHKVWPILFFISLAANVVLVVLLLGKKKKTVDNTPVVNYQIGDDDK